MVVRSIKMQLRIKEICCSRTKILFIFRNGFKYTRILYLIYNWYYYFTDQEDGNFSMWRKLGYHGPNLVLDVCSSGLYVIDLCTLLSVWNRVLRRTDIFINRFPLSKHFKWKKIGELKPVVTTSCIHFKRYQNSLFRFFLTDIK